MSRPSIWIVRYVPCGWGLRPYWRTDRWALRWQQCPEQGVESVYCTDPGLGQVDPPLIQHGQGVGMAFGLQGPGAAQRRHARCRRCVDAVILPPPPRES